MNTDNLANFFGGVFDPPHIHKDGKTLSLEILTKEDEINGDIRIQTFRVSLKGYNANYDPVYQIKVVRPLLYGMIYNVEVNIYNEGPEVMHYPEMYRLLCNFFRYEEYPQKDPGFE